MSAQCVGVAQTNTYWIQLLLICCYYLFIYRMIMLMQSLRSLFVYRNGVQKCDRITFKHVEQF